MRSSYKTRRSLRPRRCSTCRRCTPSSTLRPTPDRRYALLGSANMYQWSGQTFEVGVVIEAKGEGEILVDALEQLAIELRVTPETIQA